MLKSANTPMQKNNSAACWVIWWWWIFRGIKGRLKDFCNLLGLQKLTINEQDVSVRACKKVECTPSKLYENEVKTWRNHQRHHHKVQGEYFWFRYTCLHGVPGWTSRAADHYQHMYDQSLMDDMIRKLVLQGLQKNIVMNGDTMIDKGTDEVLGPEVDSTYWKDKF